MKAIACNQVYSSPNECCIACSDWWLLVVANVRAWPRRLRSPACSFACSLACFLACSRACLPFALAHPRCADCGVYILEFAERFVAEWIGEGEDADTDGREMKHFVATDENIKAKFRDQFHGQAFFNDSHIRVGAAPRC